MYFASALFYILLYSLLCILFYRANQLLNISKKIKNKDRIENKTNNCVLYYILYYVLCSSIFYSANALSYIITLLC